MSPSALLAFTIDRVPHVVVRLRLTGLEPTPVVDTDWFWR
jgi:hypothetical protein